ncbi:MAG: hypothetical protein KJO29_13315 [Bacteroidia bacterium]|nr:hypothetical protein [Bacteroidia bacterium]
MNYRNILISFLLCVLCSVQIQAQEKDTDLSKHVIVYLNDGSQVEGDIINWMPGYIIEIKTAWSDNVTFRQEDIKKVIQKSTLKQKHIVPYNFKEKGLNYSLKWQMITGNAGSRANSVNGIGFSVSAGHRFNRFISLGGGMGWDQYVWNSGEKLIPFFAEFSGFAHQSQTSLMYNLQLGYSLALKDEDYLISHARGGIMVYPSIGLRFGRNENIKYTFDIGYKFQKAEFHYDDVWEWGRRSEQNLLYKRLTLRFGLLLQ